MARPRFELSPRGRTLAAAAWLATLLLGGVLVAAPLPGATSSHAAPAAAPAEPRHSSGASQRMANACTRCHTFDETLSHPVDVSPKIPVPQGFPLENGKLVCTTCHVSLEHTGREKGMMLRTPEVESSGLFCAQCHAPRKGARANPHAGSAAKAHLYRARAGASDKTRTVRGLDTETQSCLACHDGAASMDAGTHQTRAFGTATEHPVGVEYRPKLTGDIRLNDPLHLDKRIRLFDRAVGCGSCHSVYSKQDKLLVVPNARSQLCLSCHVE